MKLEPTGERMITDHYKSSLGDFVIYILHLASYRFAEKYTQGKRVLDYGCGSGYGSAIIADNARLVTAIDVADDAIEYARQRFERPNLDFQLVAPTARLPFDDDSFDVVLSFQVLEHVLDPHQYLSEIKRVLTDSGELILITPDRVTRLLPFQRPWNRWHVREYGERQLRELLRQHFDHVQIMGMTAKPEMINHELRRCNRIKWLMLPFTLPVMPDRWRVACLNLIHRVRRRPTSDPTEFPFSIEDVTIATNADPSVNLVAVASRP